MTKVNITRIDSVTNNDTAATTAINNNFQALQTAIENTLSRDGTTPNFMDANLDLNAHKIINVQEPESDNDVVTKKWVTDIVGNAASYSAEAVESALAAASSAQASSVSAQEAAARASLAADQAAIAKDWATKTDGTVDGTDYSAKYYAQQITPIAEDITTVAGIAEDVSAVADISTDVTAVADIATDVPTVASNTSDISTVATGISDVSAVAGDITKVAAVADDLTKIDAVYANATNINTVADDLTNVDAVATDVANINAVADNLTNINAVNSNKTNIDTVAGISTDVTTVAGISTDVTAVAAIASDIDILEDMATDISTVAGIASNVTTVAGISSDVSTVAGISSDISAVEDMVTDISTVAGISTAIATTASISSDVSTVASNSASVTAVAGDLTNIDAVAADLTNIDNASTYAAEAKQWAVGEPTEPSGGSAKYWAGQAAAGQVQADWTEADSTSKAYIKNKPTIDQSYNALSTNAQSGTAVAEALLTVEALPSQTGNSGKYLTTDGTDASWDNVKLVENVRDENVLGLWQGTEQEWEQAKETDWKFWQTDLIVSAEKTSISANTVGYHDGLWVKGYYKSGGGVINYLSNGSWATATVTGTVAAWWTRIFYFNNKWIALGRNSGGSASYIATSTDAITWTSIQTDTFLPSIISADNNQLTCSDTVVISASQDGNYIVYSSDGENWSASDLSTAGKARVAYGAGKFVTTWVSGNQDHIAYSTDGATWTSLSAGTVGFSLKELVYANGKFLAIGGTTTPYKKYATSTDGVNWTSGNINISVPSNFSLAFINGYFVIIGNDETISTSTDGINWTTVSSAFANISYVGQITPSNGGDFYFCPFVTTSSAGTLLTGSLSSSSCYTTDAEPTTTSTVYSAPNTVSALTVTTGGSSSIVLSDSNTYNRVSAGDISTYQDAGTAYPNHLAFVDGKRIKKGTTTIVDTSVKQDTLVSGTNIKTINGESVLGSGDLSVGITASYDAEKRMLTLA